jgi:hypothetical protein
MAVLVAASVLVASPIAARAQACQEVQLTLLDARVTAGCASTFGFCAGGTVTGDFEGTTFFTMDGAVRGPATAPGYAAASGILIYTTQHGTLTVRENGITNMPLNASRGHGAAVQDVLEGTGDFAGVTGALALTQEPGGDGFFLSHVTGVLCFPR